MNKWLIFQSNCSLKYKNLNLMFDLFILRYYRMINEPIKRK